MPNTEGEIMESNNLTTDQKAKLRECKSTDEFEALAKDEGMELSDDQLEAVSGGFDPLTDEDHIDNACFDF